jgi:hypothetical protein
MSQRKVRFFNTTGPCNPDDRYIREAREQMILAREVSTQMAIPTPERWLAVKLF